MKDIYDLIASTPMGPETEAQEVVPDVGKLTRLLGFFRREEITAKALEKNKEEVKEEYKLSEGEIHYIIARL